MRLWLGHYYGNPKEWFIVWARTKEDAYEKVDEIGEPDKSSFAELKGPGIVNFRVKFRKPEPDEDEPWLDMKFVQLRGDDTWLDIEDDMDSVALYIYMERKDMI